MDVEEVKRRIEGIRQIAGDDEMAHVGEAKLRGDVLQAIANGAPNAAELAQEALKTTEIEFSRWFA